MSVLMEFDTKKIENIFFEIDNIAINRLRKNFKNLNLEIVEINNLTRLLNKIKRVETKSQKQKHLEMFLLGNYEHFEENKNTPLNIFYLDCGIIYSKYFL